MEDKLYKLIIVILVVLTTSFQVKAKHVVIQGEERTDYFTSILRHALAYSPKENYQLAFHGKDVPKSRVIEMIANHQELDIIAGSLTREREAKLMAIKVPLLKGMNGWRIPLVMTQDKLQHVSSIEELRKFKAGQLHSWSDAKILEGNQVPIVKGSDYYGLFSMLVNNRFDYFPRSVLEVAGEFSQVKHMGIKIDQNVLIKYPSAYYFYVNKDAKHLARDIKYGLESSLADGSFDRIFANYYADALKIISTHKRTNIELNNPLMPTKTSS